MGEPVHAERASPLFQDFAKYNRKTVATPARLHANLGFATLLFSSSLPCLKIKNRKSSYTHWITRNFLPQILIIVRIKGIVFADDQSPDDEYSRVHTIN